MPLVIGAIGCWKNNTCECFSKKLGESKIKILDGDILRRGINNNLGFSVEDRIENVRRTAEIAKSFFLEEGYWVIVAVITPLEIMRQNNRQILGESYIEIFVNTPIEICEQRDPKGLYAKVAQKQLSNFTGKDSPFEIPITPNLEMVTTDKSIEECVKEIQMFIFSDKP